MKKFFHKISYSKTAKMIGLVLLACASSLTFVMFIIPNNFAPAGVNGIATMVQYLCGVSIGYLALIINIPLLIVAALVGKRKFALRTFVYIATFSVASIFLQQFTDEMKPIIYTASDNGGAIMAAVAGGLFAGVIYSLSVRLGGCTGGTDVVAVFIQMKKPEYDLAWIMFALNAGVAVMSFFVYGMTYEPVLLCIIYSFVSSKTTDLIMKGARSAAKFEVITDSPEELSAELIRKLKHGCTVVPAKGMFTHTDRSLLICVVNRHQIVEFEHIISKYENTFAYVSTVSGTIGSFKHIK